MAWPPQALIRADSGTRLRAWVERLGLGGGAWVGAGGSVKRLVWMSSMRVDAEKLGTVREAMDLLIVRTAMEMGLSRLGAAAALADRMGFALRLLGRPGGWVVYAVHREVWRRALALAVQGAAISATGTELLEREPWHFESESRDDAIMATLCRLLDENLDVSAGDGQRPNVPCAHGARHAAMGEWFEPVKQQWAMLAAMRKKAKQNV